MCEEAEGIYISIYFFSVEISIFRAKSSNTVGMELNPIILEANMGQKTEWNISIIIEL